MSDNRKFDTKSTQTKKRKKIQTKARNNSKNNQSVINLGFKQEKAKESFLFKYSTDYSYVTPCIMNHRDSSVMKVNISAQREGDLFSVSMCRDCLENLLFALRVVNEKKVYYGDNTELSVRYLNSFSKGSFCYFCGFGDTACYDVRLNMFGLHMCAQCRERTIIQLKDRKSVV